MHFEDEPIAGENLPIRPGHVSPGRLERILRAGTFAVTAEIAPPDSADPHEVFERARIFDGYVDAMNATDGSGAHCHMSSVGMCSLLTRHGYAMVMQVSCRDRNRIAIQGDVLGASAMGVSNILCLTGDSVQAGDHPQAKPVFDLDCMSTLDMLRTMRDESRFLSGRPLSTPPRVLLGAAANPFAPPLDYRPQRLAKKIAAGAQFIQTQYCFDIERFREYMRQVRDLGCHEKAFILAGIGPLASARSAEWIRSNVAGVHIPDALIRRLAGAANQAREGVEACIELIGQLREIEGVAGVHIMAYRQEHRVAEIVERSAVLAGRVPWYPGRDAVQTGAAPANRKQSDPEDGNMTDTLLSSHSKEVTIGFDRPFVIIGERINPTGRKILAAEMAAGDFSRVEADALAQVAAGAHMLDVNAGIPLADEPAILADAIKLVQSITDVPLCIDSSIVAALESGLAVYQGKALVNSVTGEEDRLETVLPLVAKYGAAVVAISNDETGISEDPDVRFEVARKIVERAADYGIPHSDVVVDPLVMPIGAINTAARQVMHLVRRLRDELKVNTTCGASNVSFGLPNRNGIGGAFLSMAIGAGMTSAITNPLHAELVQAVLGADVMMGHDPDCTKWIRRYRDPTAVSAQSQRAGRRRRRG